MRLVWLSVLFVFLGLGAGCSTTQVRPGVQIEISETGDEAQDQIVRHFKQWEGVPYEWGGNDMSGIDCSAYVRDLYKNQFDLALPRTTLEQLRLGLPASRSGLQAGDLVFFSPSGKGRHVGVYLRDGIFVHASTSRGVMASSLEESYWKKSYVTARRLLGFTD